MGDAVAVVPAPTGFMEGLRAGEPGGPGKTDDDQQSALCSHDFDFAGLIPSLELPMLTSDPSIVATRSTPLHPVFHRCARCRMAAVAIVATFGGPAIPPGHGDGGMIVDGFA